MDETLFRRAVFVFLTIVFCLPSFQMHIEYFQQSLAAVVLFGIEVDMKDGVYLPVGFHLFDGKAFKQVASPLEVGF